MAMERTWNVVPPQTLTANGTTLGVVTVADTAGFYIKQDAYLTNSSGPSSNLPVQIKRILGSTTMVVGPIDNKITSFKPLDVSAYTVASGAQIGAQEQPKNKVPDGDHYLAVYEGDPINADRVISVDQHGDHYSSTNPVPVTFDGTISIGEVEVIGPSGHLLDPNADGSLNVVLESGSIEIGKVDQGLPGPITEAWPVQPTDGVNSQKFNNDGSVKEVQLFTKPWDAITTIFPFPSPTQEIYQSRIGGITGAIQQTATLNYTDASKRFMLNVAVV